MLFKELRWQTLRIEAQSIIEQDLPPLRLLTLEAVCRLIIKKRLSGKESNVLINMMFF